MANPVNVPPVSLQFTDFQTKITAAWLNFINAIANSPAIIPTQTAATIPTTGTWNTGDYVRNSAVTILGPTTAPYIVDGWQCIAGGTPGQWVEIQLPVRTSAPAPTPAPAPLFDQVIQAENMTGTALAVLTGPLVGYMGTGYNDWATVAGKVLTGTFTGVGAGNYHLKIRYYNYNDQQNTLKVDGVAHTGLLFTKSDPSWAVYDFDCGALGAGSHTFDIVSDWGYTYWDQIELVQTSGTPAPPPAPAPAPGASAIAFGSRADGAYPNGIHPTASNATLDGYIQTMYTTWKNNRLAAAPTLNPTHGIYAGTAVTGGYYVDTNTVWIQQPTYDANGNIVPGTGIRAATVSEAMGYGMLIMVIMAGYDANAKTYFDGMYKFVRSLPAYAMLPSYYNNDTNPQSYLMDWRVGMDMSSQGGGWNANDGDMDIALALLMANRQWGSAGAINYYADALKVIDALKVTGFNQSTTLLGIPYLSTKDISRTSDYMLGHFRSYKKATNDTFWDSAVTNCESVANTVITGYSATAKLLPGWIYKPLTAPQPSPGNLLEGPYEGDFDQNAVRDPWRFAADYVWSGDASAKALATGMVAEIKLKAGSAANQLTWDYKIDGTPVTGGLYYEPTTAGGQVAGACVDVAHQAWLDALVTQISGNYNVKYYGAELQLLGMIVASGNWWRP